MTLSELKKQERLIDEERELLDKEKQELLNIGQTISNYDYLTKSRVINNKIFDNNDRKIENLKAQIELLTN